MARNIYIQEKLSVKIVRQFKTILKYLFLYTFIIVFFLAISWILVKSYKYVTTTKIFALKYVEIKGLKNLTKEEILKKLNISYGKNIFDINLFEIKKRLLKDKWIKDVMIKRIIPNKIVISITEREPVYILHEKRSLYYIDKDGTKIAKFGNKILDLPVIEMEDKQLFSKISNYLTKGLPISINNIGWVYVGNIYVKFYDYKNKILWKIDVDSLSNSLSSARLIWREINRTFKGNNIKEITVINYLGWVALRN